MEKYDSTTFTAGGMKQGRMLADRSVGGVGLRKALTYGSTLPQDEGGWIWIKAGTQEGTWVPENLHGESLTERRLRE